MAGLAERVLIDTLAGGAHAVAVFGPDDVLVYANPTFRTLFALPAGDDALTFSLIMRRCHEGHCGLVIDTDNFEAWLKGVCWRRRGMTTRAFESDFHDGCWVRVNERRHPDGSICFIGTDITTLKNNEKTLRRDRDSALQAANTDALTGLFNRRHMMARMAQLVDGMRSGSICMLDLDHFKRINDTHGHPVGDLVLRHFAAIGLEHLRPQDLLGRIGGEEFLLILPDASMHTAQQVLERLRDELVRATPIAQADVRYTFSAGLTSIGTGDSVDSVMQRADAALYQAKGAGRNCCVLLSCPPA